MAQTTNLIVFSKGAFADLPSTRSENTLYFCTDTRQIFIGEHEYTKSTKTLAAEPTSATEGEIGCLYAYNGNLYLCANKSGSTYTWTRVANINDNAGTVTSIEVGEGLTTVSGSTSVTATDTIKHAVPSGATTVENQVAGDSPLAFGSTFSVQGIATDKFGHVIGSTASTFTLPTETALTVEAGTPASETLSAGSTFAVVTAIEEGTADQSVKQTTTTFTLPADVDTTYTFSTSSTEDGGITVTPSTGTAYDVVPKGWSDLAKKSDITSVLKFKGSKATASQLPATAEVGDVWAVEEDNSEYVCTVASSTDPVTAPTWEKLGPVIDLSAYALSADVIQRVSPATAGDVAIIKADGTLEDSGFTLGCSVPATAVFTDTTYVAATTAADGLMSSTDKAKLDGIATGAEVNVLEGVKVNGSTLAIDADKCVDLGSYLSWQTF